MKERTEADDLVQGAANRALLDLILPPMRRVAKDLGYALTVHGSLNRDIDFVAIPWVPRVEADQEQLATALRGAVASITGRCLKEQGFSEKPHGRRAYTLLAWCGQTTTHLDLSIMPALPTEKDE